MRVRTNDSKGTQWRVSDRFGLRARLSNVRYPLTLGSAILIIAITMISSQVLVNIVTNGTHEQLIRTLQNKISHDLAREIDGLRNPGEVTSLDRLVGHGRIDS